jgi:large subunit ribosomal protein L24
MVVKKGDTVIVISGNYKGKQGTVLKVNTKDNRVVVEGVNVVSRHTRPSQANPDGGIIKKEAPIDASNVMLVDPKTNKPTRIHFEEKDGKKVRVAKSGSVIK